MSGARCSSISPEALITSTPLVGMRIAAGFDAAHISRINPINNTAITIARRLPQVIATTSTGFAGREYETRRYHHGLQNATFPTAPQNSQIAAAEFRPRVFFCYTFRIQDHGFRLPNNIPRDCEVREFFARRTKAVPFSTRRQRSNPPAGTSLRSEAL